VIKKGGIEVSRKLALIERTCLRKSLKGVGVMRGHKGQSPGSADEKRDRLIASWDWQNRQAGAAWTMKKNGA